MRFISEFGAEIYDALEKKYGYPLELEFSIHNDTVYILQAKAVTSSFVKPHMGPLNESLLDDNKILIGSEGILSSMGYLNNEEVFIEIIDVDQSVQAKGVPFYMYDDKEGRETIITEELKRLETKYTEGYICAIDRGVDFPSISKNDYPNLKAIIIKSINGLGSHALTIIREVGIPVLLLKDTSDFFEKELSGKYLTYINSSESAVVYKQ